jgi:hypothetical protein
MTEDDRATAIGLSRYAYEYIDAARTVAEQHNMKLVAESLPTMPAYFLAMHGIELTFKAYLRHSGVSASELSTKRYGHDLHACYRKAKEFGLLAQFKVGKDDLLAMGLLINLNQSHGLRYIQIGPKRFPSWGIVERFAVRLHQAVAKCIHPNCETFSARFSTCA